MSGGEFLFQVDLTLAIHVGGFLGLRFGAGNEPIRRLPTNVEQEVSEWDNSQFGYSYFHLLPGFPEQVRYQEQFDVPKSDDDWYTNGTSSGIFGVTGTVLTLRSISEPFLFQSHPAFRVIDLDRCMILFICNSDIAEHIQQISIFADGYRVLHVLPSDLSFHPGSFERFHLTNVEYKPKDQSD